MSEALPEVDTEGITNKKGMIRMTAHAYSKVFRGDFGQARDLIILESSWLGASEPIVQGQVISFIGQMMQDQGQFDMLEKHLADNKISFNFKEIYLGGGSPTYYKKEEFSYLIGRLKNLIDFSKLGDFTIEVDPRRVTEETLLFYHEMGINRLSFGIQDFDHGVQEEINRIQPPELLDKLLTPKIRKLFPVINFDLLIGLPRQTTKTIEKTIKEVTKLQPSQLQTMYAHYKSGTGKSMTKMVRD